MLKKQSDFYHLHSLSYPDEIAAQSIKVYNPNDIIYDVDWFDTY